MMDQWEEKVDFVRKHYEKRGYRVHSGLQFGCELVLYADDPQHVHSDFCIHVVGNGKSS
jgi:tRNA splicing endonuclease